MDRNNGRYVHRRQSNQHVDNHHHSHHNSNSGSAPLFSSPTNLSQQPPVSREAPLTQHDELIRYIREAWTNVNEHGTPVIYHNEADAVKNFKPFNLEEYWGQRHVQNIQVSHGNQ